MRVIIISFLALFILAGCGQSDVERVKGIQSDAHHTGKIIKKDRGNDRILVEELISNSDQPLSTLWITINDETEVLDTEGNVISFGKLKRGQLIEAWNNGMILESLPGQTTAIKINLLPKHQTA